MSERLTHSPETSHAEQPIVRPERSHAAEDPSKHTEQLQDAREAVQATAYSSERPHLPIDDPAVRPQVIDSTAKRLRMRQNLRHVQNKLKPAEKRFSEVVHQPLVQAVSESASKTVARPSGLFGAGLVAFLGSSGYLWLAHHYAIPYNYTLFLLFFAAGFVIGLAGEFGFNLINKSRR